MFVRCGHEQIQTLPNFCRISFLYDQTQKGTSFKRMPIDNSASIGMRRRVRFFVYSNTVVLFVFFASRPNDPLIFFCKKIRGRVCNEMPGKRKRLGTKKWVQSGKNDGDEHFLHIKTNLCIHVCGDSRDSMLSNEKLFSSNQQVLSEIAGCIAS